MKYRRPSDADMAEYIDHDEYQLMRARGATDRDFNQRASSNAWAQHKMLGAVGRIRALCEAEPGAYVVLPEYRRTPQVSQMVAAAARRERAKFASRVERHDLTDEPIGVRVTFLGFVDSSDGSLIE
jgi:hypothetical protein